MTVKRWVLILLGWWVLVPMHSRANEPVVRSMPIEVQEKLTFLNSKYVISLPIVKDGNKLPIVIYLHGAGGRGDEIGKAQRQLRGLMRGCDKFVKEPCILVAPQCLMKQVADVKSTWTAEDLNVFLAHLKATLPIDSGRIYLTGNSMGGYGTWLWGASNPEHFAAIAPMSGGIGRDGPKAITPEVEKWATNLAKIPVYAFAGGEDKVVPVDRSEMLIAAIKKAGGKLAKLKIYPEAGHGAGRQVLSSEEFYTWLFSQKRK